MKKTIILSLFLGLSLVAKEGVGYDMNGKEVKCFDSEVELAQSLNYQIASADKWIAPEPKNIHNDKVWIEKIHRN